MTDKKENPHNDSDNANSSDIQAHLDALLSGKVESSKPKRSKKTDETHSQSEPTQVNNVKRSEEKQDKPSAITTVDEEKIKSSKRPHLKRTPLLFAHEWAAIKTIVILVIMAAGLIYLISPNGQVQRYEVVGTHELSDKTVLNAAGLRTGQSLLATVNQSDYFSQEAKRKNPQINHLKLSIKSDNTLQVKVDEIVKVGYVKAGNKYYPILENGSMLNQGLSNQQVGGLPLYDGFTSDKQLRKTLAEFGKLSDPLRHAVSEIVWSPNSQNNQRLLIYMNDGNEVLISADELSKKMKYYPGMVAQLKQTGVADLQVGAYFKPYD
ncbi:cell division protein FtsQ/DivIB [Weissella paramesenteroides]|jgi:cell division protein FtsQ|uniref:Cell division protein DivIB n=2 Tax=Weissella paramesenteroides TaxID=1249 RepID=C5RAG5_WEIPA|nr:cell division protein FtsQ/DivIB [Weissella paramesenteroides]ATF40857.1 cell division protein [Weissella paramesenteroides]EER74808.1 cell division protein FtsQ [Weissella paramesenteroides ATCC 33313]KAA8444952.1 FtsQ-type POTRA domain-containing protein [Weissella paramesenteroides]KAA8452712.1 FtsQ-type POTRA domain-containing protein [Weissella paramesenteroides]KAA8455366.1 FtsQ-type POTRA domain-containing protein [Weissella paramesenteroides]